jgi:hypothetical protein
MPSKSAEGFIRETAMTTSSHYRTAFAISAAAWLAALALPVHEVILSHRIPNLRAHQFYGLRWFEFGWVGLVSFCFAWYANVLLAICWWRMAHGQPPGRKLSLWALGLAATVLIPHVSWTYLEQYGSFPATMAGTGLWVWLIAFGEVAWVGGRPA